MLTIGRFASLVKYFTIPKEREISFDSKAKYRRAARRRIMATVLAIVNGMLIHKYYINRVSWSQDYIPKKCCYTVF